MLAWRSPGVGLASAQKPLQDPYSLRRAVSLPRSPSPPLQPPPTRCLSATMPANPQLSPIRSVTLPLNIRTTRLNSSLRSHPLTTQQSSPVDCALSPVEQMIRQTRESSLNSDRPPNLEERPPEYEPAPKFSLGSDESNYLVVVKAPRIQPHDLAVSVQQDGSLRISGRTKTAEVAATSGASGSGSSCANLRMSFQRSIRLPADADLGSEQCAAKHEGGTLTVVVPRRASAPRARQLLIRCDGSALDARNRDKGSVQTR